MNPDPSRSETSPPSGDPTPRPVAWWSSLYVRVLIAIALGVLLGIMAPSWAVQLEPLGKLFVRLIKMIIAPVVFCTVTVGIASMGSLERVGRVGAKALLYFEVLTTVALMIGLGVVEWIRPGAGVHATAAQLDAHAVAGFATRAQDRPHGLVGWLEELVPENFFGALAKGEILQILLIAVVVGLALASMQERGKPIVAGLERVTELFFTIVAMLMKLAPLGAFGAMAFTVGRFGVHSLASLAKLMATFYLTSILFVILILAPIVRFVVGVSPWRFFYFLRDEFLLVLGTSSSESALPGLIAKLERMGCAQSVVGLVVPTGYSFNLDGTSIYLTMAAMYVAQATDTHLTLGQKLSLLGVLLVTSKGAAAVTGGGFVTLAATLSATGEIPVAGLSLLLGVDRFMSEARALTNLAGNAVATAVVARWEGALDQERARDVLDRATRDP